MPSEPSEAPVLDPAHFEAMLGEHIDDRRVITDLRVLLTRLADR